MGLVGYFKKRIKQIITLLIVKSIVFSQSVLYCTK